MVRSGRNVAGYPRAGLQDGWQVGPVQAGSWITSAVKGINPGHWMEGSEGIGVGEVTEDAGKGRAGPPGRARGVVYQLLDAVEISYDDRRDW